MPPHILISQTEIDAVGIPEPEREPHTGINKSENGMPLHGLYIPPMSNERYGATFPAGSSASSRAKKSVPGSKSPTGVFSPNPSPTVKTSDKW